MIKTFTFSLLLHGMLLSASLILTGGRGTMLHEKVFLVNLAEDPQRSERNGPHFRRGEEGPEKPVVEDTIEVPVPVEKSLEKENHDLIMEETPPADMEPVRHERSYEETQAVHAVAAESALEEATERRGGAALNEGAEELVAGRTAWEAPMHAVHTSSSGGWQEKHEDKGPGIVSSRIIERIGRAIESKKTYPPLARRRGIEGTVRIGFSINPEGKPWDIELIESSGHRVLDAATLNVVKKAAPYPYTDRRIEVPVSYRLQD
jgi:protein TonB